MNLREGQVPGVPALLADPPVFSLNFTSEELSAVNSLVLGEFLCESGSFFALTVLV